jgi:hypothetical protein
MVWQAIIFTVVVSAPAVAQEDTAAVRVRLRLTSQPRAVEGFVPPQVVRGNLMRTTSDSLWIQLHPDAAPLGLSATGVSRLEVSRGAPSRMRTALIDAASLGISLGAFAALLEELEDTSRYGSTGQAAVSGALAGVAIGLVRGALFPREFWRRIGWGDLQR